MHSGPTNTVETNRSLHAYDSIVIYPVSIFGTSRTIANGGGPGREPRPVRTPWNTFCGLLRELFFIKISTHQILYFRFPGGSSGLYTSPEKKSLNSGSGR